MKSIKNGILLLVLLVSSFVNIAADVREGIGEWRIYSGVDGKTEKESLSAVLFSFAGEDAALGIRCQESQIDLYMMFSDEISLDLANAFIIKVDGVAKTAGEWSRAADQRGAFSVTPRQVMQMLKPHKVMVVTYKTRHQLHKVTAFNISGIEQLSDKIATICQLT